MHARVTTIQGSPDTVDQSLQVLREQVLPGARDIPGFKGVLSLVDRGSGKGLTVTLWESEEAMRASDAHLRAIRDRGRDILGGSMQVDEWEIAAMHRTHHGECCRVSWLQGDVDAMVESFRFAILPELEQARGFCSASLMVNRSTGLGCATSAWESQAAMEASRTTADNLRSRIASDAGGEVVDVHEFDLAYAHLHVPEMA